MIDGCVRDADAIRELGLPVFARGITPAGPYKNGPGEIGGAVAIGGVAVHLAVPNVYRARFTMGRRQ